MTKRPIIWADVRERLLSGTLLSLIFVVVMAILYGVLWLVATFLPWLFWIFAAAALGWLIYAGVYTLLYGAD